jgi:hypothetical protein
MSDEKKLYERKPFRVRAKQWHKDGDDDRVVFAKSMGGQSWMSDQWVANTIDGYQVVLPGHWLVDEHEGLLVMSDAEFTHKYRPVQRLTNPDYWVD